MNDLKVIAALLASVPAASNAADLAGTWSGTWTKNGDALPVQATFAESATGYSGIFDSDALQVAGIPFEDVRESGGRVHFVLKGDQSTTVFDGREKAGNIVGTFSENATTGMFHLTRSSAAVTPIDSRDVTFNNGDVKLAGSVLRADLRGGKPAILFLQGSGPEGRFANRWLAQRFARAGFVALIYDKRGVGGSTGDWMTAGFAELADDAVAGIRFLQKLPDVDPTKVGIYGHSQGGTIAPLVAARAGDLAFVIASAAGGIDPAKIEEYSVVNTLRIASMTQDEARDARAFVHSIVDVAYRGHPRSELDDAATRFRGRSWYFEPPPPDNYYWSFSRRIADFRPATCWRQVKAPTLLLYGSKDERIPPSADVRAIVAALRSGGNLNVSVITFANADHTFTLPATGGRWPKHVPGYADTVIHWSQALIRQRHAKALGF